MHQGNEQLKRFLKNIGQTIRLHKQLSHQPCKNTSKLPNLSVKKGNAKLTTTDTHP